MKQESYRVVNFWMVVMFLFHLLIELLLLLAVLLIHSLQTFPPLMLLQHLILLELIVAVLVKVLQVCGRLHIKTKRWDGEILTWIVQLVLEHSLFWKNTYSAITVASTLLGWMNFNSIAHPGYKGFNAVISQAGSIKHDPFVLPRAVQITQIVQGWYVHIILWMLAMYNYTCPTKPLCSINNLGSKTESKDD